MDLVRRILRAIQEQEPGDFAQLCRLLGVRPSGDDDYDAEAHARIRQHIRIMTDAGFIQTATLQLTWAGYDLLDTIPRASGAQAPGTDQPHDFDPLRQQYPSVIATLPDTFTSHEFILALARHCQALYIEALHTYRDHRGDHQGPFQVVHGRLARMLGEFPALVENTGYTVSSQDIFGNAGDAVQWRKR